MAYAPGMAESMRMTASNVSAPMQHYSLLTALFDTFSMDMIPMGIMYAIFSAFIGYMYARNRHTIEAQNKKLTRYATYLNELVEEQTREIKFTQVTSIEALAKLAEYNDVDTGKHLERIQNYVRILAKTVISP